MKQLFILLGLSILLSACGGYAIDSNISETVADFEFTTQDNETLNLDDLKGEWWIADFIFTNCTTVCLPMTANMATLQTKLENEGIDAKLVSFSVDPDFDSPEVLKAYGESYGANFDNWFFLTGYDFNTIKELSVNSFRNLVEQPPEGSDQVYHGTRFFLVSPEGEVVKYYGGIESSEIDLIVNDLKKVQ